MEVDAGREDETIIGQRNAIGRHDAAQLRLDCGYGFGGYPDALGGDPFITKLLDVDLAATRDHPVAGTAGSEDGTGFDQDDLQVCLRALQRAGARRTTEAAADHDDAARRLRAQDRRGGE